MTINTTIYELHPTSGQKSFGGKAKVMIHDNKEILLSYDTPICYREFGTIHRLYEKSLSMTTAKHVKSFCGLNKKEFEKLPVEE